MVHRADMSVAMPSVNGAKTKWVRNTTADAVVEGVAEFTEEEGAASAQEAWEGRIQETSNQDYTGGVEEFLESEGGMQNAEVNEDYDWQSQTLSGGSTWESDLRDGLADYDQKTDENDADRWFDRYANAYGDN